MNTQEMKRLALETLDRGFNQGDLTVWDEVLAEGGVDHQEAKGTPFAEHLKQVVTAMRAAFPDLRFEVHHVVAEDDLVAFHSTMTGTHTGVFALGPFANVPPRGVSIAVMHMHLLRHRDGRFTDLWHVWDVAGLMRQLGAAPGGQGGPRPVANGG